MEQQDKLNSRIYSMLGLAAKAGQIASGEFSAEKCIKSRKAYVVIVSDDASDNTKKLFCNKCKSYSVPIYYFGTKEELRHAIGKAARTSLAVTDKNFAELILSHLEKSGNREGEEEKNGKN